MPDVILHPPGKPSMRLSNKVETLMGTASNGQSLTLSYAQPPLPEFATVALGIAGVDDGKDFLVTPEQGGFAARLRRNGDDADFLRWEVYAPAGSLAEIRMAAMRARTGRRQYEWDFRSHYDGRFVPNCGTYGDVAPEPDIGQLLGGASVVFDQDGATNGVRRVWPAGVVNSLGHEEVVQIEFDTSARELNLWYLQDLNDGTNPTVDLRFYLSSRRTAGEATNEPQYLGINGRAGTPTDFTLDDTFTVRTVDLPAYVNGTTQSIVVEPNTTATPAPAYPQKFDIEYAGMTLLGVVPPTLTVLRNQYRAGHAMPAYALGNASLSASTGFRPTAAHPNLLANMRRDTITNSWWTFYVNLAEAAFDNGEAHIMSYGREDRTESDQSPRGAMLVASGTPLDASSGSNEYAGRFTPKIAGNSSFGTQRPCDTFMWGCGLTRIDVIVAGSGDDSRMNNNLADPGDLRCVILQNLKPHTEYFIDAYPAGWDPRIMYLGGYETSVSKAFMLLTGRNIGSPSDLVLARYGFGYDDIPDWETLRDEAEFDRDVLGIELADTEFALMVMGDSTSRFSGNPHFVAAYDLRGLHREFNNLSTGGAFYDSVDPNERTAIFNSDGYTSLRVDYFKGAAWANTKRGIALSHGGENNPTHMDDPEQAVADYAAMMPAEADEHCPGVFTHVIVTVRPSGADALAGQPQKDTFNAYLRTRFSVQVDAGNPYLFSDPNYDGTGFKYMIDLDAWVPRHPDHSLTYTSWTDLLVNDTGVGKSNKIISGDFQHWGGSFGGKYAAIDVFIPSYELIATEEWGYTL